MDVVFIVLFIDDGYKLVVLCLGDCLCVVGICELNGYICEFNIICCEVIICCICELFLDGCDYENLIYWIGLCLLILFNVFYVGKIKFVNLYLNIGYGILGWIMGCGFGCVIVEIVFGYVLEIDFVFIGLLCWNCVC